MRPSQYAVMLRFTVGSARVVVRRLFRDDHVVDVALAEALRGGADEPRRGAEVLDGLRAGVAHAGAEAADQLVEDRGERAAVRDATLDAFRHELLVGGAALAVAILAALLHRAE